MILLTTLLLLFFIKIYYFVGYSERSIPIIKKKWDNLRSGHRNSKRTLPSGSAANANNSQYKYTGLLNFLDENVAPRPYTLIYTFSFGGYY